MSDELATIKEKIAKNKAYLYDTFGVEKIGVFGSFVHGDQTPTSDIDIAIAFKENTALGLVGYSDLQEYLEADFGRKVDLITEKSIRPAFKKYILPTIVYI